MSPSQSSEQRRKRPFNHALQWYTSHHGRHLPVWFLRWASRMDWRA